MFNIIKKILYPLTKEIRAVFTYPSNRIDLEQDDYDAYWEKKRGGAHLATLSSWQEARARYIASEIIKTSPVSVVDIACGTGNILKYLKDTIPGMRTIGVDVSPKALLVAKTLGIETKETSDILKTLEYMDPVDYILFLEILEHLPNAEMILKAGVVKAKRAVFFSIPNTGYITYRLRLLFGKVPAQWHRHPGEHVRFWTMQDVKWWLRALSIDTYTIHTYKGVPLLNKVWPALFGAAFVVMIRV